MADKKGGRKSPVDRSNNVADFPTQVVKAVKSGDLLDSAGGKDPDRASVKSSKKS